MMVNVDNDSVCVSHWRARPGSFVSLMTLYESNYIRLAWLAPRVESLAGTMISEVRSDCPLHLRIEEQTRYTTTLTLTYVFDQGTPAEQAIPDLLIRVYHDARLAEVLESAPAHRHAGLEEIRAQLSRDLSDRWQRNVMLNKWLDYCAERGHRFAVASESVATRA
jgi:uncharacterized protein